MLRVDQEVFEIRKIKFYFHLSPTSFIVYFCYFYSMLPFDLELHKAAGEKVWHGPKHVPKTICVLADTKDT